MYRIGRFVSSAVRAKSMFERCTGASTNAPSAGTCSPPTICTRPKAMATSRISADDGVIEERVHRVSGPSHVRASSPGRRAGAGVVVSVTIGPLRCRLRLGVGDQVEHRVDDVVDVAVGGVDGDRVVGLRRAGWPRGPGRGRRAGRCRRRRSRSRGRSPPWPAGRPGPRRDAVRYTFRAASGNTTRADVAALDHAAAALGGPLAAGGSRSSVRTAGLAATVDTARVTSGPRISMVASTPSTVTTPLSTSMSRVGGEGGDRVGVGRVDVAAGARRR